MKQLMAILLALLLAGCASGPGSAEQTATFDALVREAEAELLITAELGVTQTQIFAETVGAAVTDTPAPCYARGGFLEWWDEFSSAYEELNLDVDELQTFNSFTPKEAIGIIQQRATLRQERLERLEYPDCASAVHNSFIAVNALFVDVLTTMDEGDFDLAVEKTDGLPPLMDAFIAELEKIAPN